MALYQFCAHKKGGNFKRAKHILGEAKHDLQILDLISMQFNTKEDLMRFLGLNLDEFDDVAITYQSNGEAQKLDVILADAPELEDILYSMVDFGVLEEYDEILKLALAYDAQKYVTVTNKVNRESLGFNRIKEPLISEPCCLENAFRVGSLHRRAYDFYSRGQDELFLNEITKSYLTIRKLYMYLRSRGIIRPKPERRAPVLTDLHTIINELKNNDSVYSQLISMLMKISTTDYEDDLINKILKGDSEALEQFMQLDSEHLSKFREFLALLPKYLEELRRSRKTFERDLND